VRLFADPFGTLTVNERLPRLHGVDQKGGSSINGAGYFRSAFPS